jgi:sigma-E factor negative regulatory protein RseC
MEDLQHTGDDAIRHAGIVERVQGDMAVVRIAQTSACAGCHAAKMCMASESREKRIEARMTEPVNVGDEVEVMVREQAGWLAVCLAYVIPFLLLVAAVAGFDKMGWSEAKAGTAALVSVAVYYIILRMFRDKLQRKFTFWVRPIR